MAQTAMLQYNQDGSVSQQQPDINSTFIVVNQQPNQREVFPYRLDTKKIMNISSGKAFVGILYIILGFINAVLLKIYTSVGILCIFFGFLLIAGGIIGCILRSKPVKCLVGVILGLNIASLIIESILLVMLIDFLVYLRGGFMPGRLTHPITIAAWSFTCMVIIEMTCSGQLVLHSSKAYSKFCNTCNTDDCCTFLGCCECDFVPLDIQNVNA